VADGGLREVSGTRYVTPLREGGSLPGIVEADDDGTDVVTFRGAGQRGAGARSAMPPGRAAAGSVRRSHRVLVVDVDIEWWDVP
jgi:hypothetical protein